MSKPTRRNVGRTNVPTTEPTIPVVEESSYDGAVLQADRAVVRNGRSQSITIPNHIADAIGLAIGDTVRISVRQDGSLIICPMETIHSNGMTIMKPRRIKFARPKVVPVIPEGRTIRKANRLEDVAHG